MPTSTTLPRSPDSEFLTTQKTPDPMHPNPPSPTRVNRTSPSLSHVPPHHRLSYEIPSCSKSKKKSKSGKGNKFPLGFVTPNACSTRHSQPPIRTRLGFFRISHRRRSAELRREASIDEFSEFSTGF
ncbi:hypothetical protein C1H46_018609 [Malus baccata]|uniref:Uncharacterized protein n=1 Tax=Malus baccata TaxID=106549 RepID=A0A540MAK6_MALBA|nr:hypothetical protein C1H46_018609 [Malus baccata]